MEQNNFFDVDLSRYAWKFEYATPEKKKTNAGNIS